MREYAVPFKDVDGTIKYHYVIARSPQHAIEKTNKELSGMSNITIESNHNFVIPISKEMSV